jgi:hypothetical protein
VDLERSTAFRPASAFPRALRDSFWALVSSRLLIWIAGTLTAVALGLHAGSATSFDPRNLRVQA